MMALSVRVTERHLYQMVDYAIKIPHPTKIKNTFSMHILMNKIITKSAQTAGKQSVNMVCVRMHRALRIAEFKTGFFLPRFRLIIPIQPV